MSRYDGGWAPYVPVAVRREKAAREMAKLRKKGHPVSPVVITGRKIVTTFWGKAWCDNLEGYRDYENRLPRGRTYARNGSVVDLQIAPLQINAMVSGSSIYKVAISIAAVAKTAWWDMCRDCAGGIDSLVELLQGRFSKGVMERLCRQNGGLFPKPAEIRFSCSCPDHASMCKHIAAVLYGVGARLDEKPDLLFRLRAVDETDLIAGLDAALPLAKTGPAAGKTLETDDISALFGLDMVGKNKPDEPKRDASSGPKPARKGKQAPSAPQPSIQTTEPAKRTGQTGKTAKTAVAAKSVMPPPTSRPEPTKPKSGSKKTTVSVRSKTSKTTHELTPDGYVKWWK